MKRFKLVSSLSNASDILDAVSAVIRILTLVMIIIQGVSMFKNTKDIVSE